MANDFRAASRIASSCRNRAPSGRGDKAVAWAATVGSEVIDPGTLTPFPKTDISGGYPRWRLHWFLVLVTWLNAVDI